MSSFANIRGQFQYAFERLNSLDGVGKLHLLDQVQAIDRIDAPQFAKQFKPRSGFDSLRTIILQVVSSRCGIVDGLNRALLIVIVRIALSIGLGRFGQGGFKPTGKKFFLEGL
ncbi:MAG: hypothetical protein ACKN82_04890, partial [Pirellula sp.]